MTVARGFADAEKLLCSVTGDAAQIEAMIDAFRSINECRGHLVTMLNRRPQPTAKALAAKCYALEPLLLTGPVGFSLIVRETRGGIFVPERIGRGLGDRDLLAGNVVLLRPDIVIVNDAKEREKRKECRGGQGHDERWRDQTDYRGSRES